MLVSPAEPPALRRLGQVSTIPEKHGADYLWVAHGQKVGVQRKAIPDFVASIVDGRLHREVAQMHQLGPVRALIVEGRWVWSTDGSWMGNGYRWDWARHQQATFTLQAQGVWVLSSDSQQDTARLIGELERWTKKDKHQFARARAKATGAWGKPSSREFATHLLQGLPNIGPELAERIYDELGLPWAWTVTQKELMGVEGIGPKRAAAMYSCLGRGTPADNGAHP